jgi:hypothetical protein
MPGPSGMVPVQQVPLVSIPQWNTNNYGSKGLAVNATATLF